MDDSNSENYEGFYEEKDSRSHDKLVENILKLQKKHIKKSSRTEPSLPISEFSLVKSISGNKDTIQINELTKSLKKNKNRVRIAENANKTHRKSQLLPKPLEKNQINRIQRGISYEKTRLQLDRWEATVTANRTSNNLSFPINNDFKMDKEEARAFTSMWRVKSDLAKELEKHEPQVETFKINLEEERFPVTMKEMLAKRKEVAKLKAYQAHQEAKARRQNKIKSKKYHRIQKRERIKKTLKEFEQLQKTNPEEAFRKLEEIEKTRAEERFNLRHKSTGKWARNQQIRAKYDKESRQNLAEQLILSRELTQKSQTLDSSSEDENEPTADNVISSDQNNPWINGVQPGKEVTDFISSYKKFYVNPNQPEEEVNTGPKQSQHQGSTTDKTTIVKKNGTKNLKRKLNVSPQPDLNFDPEVDPSNLEETANKIPKNKESTDKKKNAAKELKRQLNISVESDLNIDPDKYIEVKAAELPTAISDLVTEEEGTSQRGMILEAFENDDCIAEFNQSKQDEVNKSKPKNIDLTLPGWGSWGGSGIKSDTRKKRRFILKTKKQIPRKDDNKKFLIINDKKQEKLQEQKISDVPFPFKTVKDFEASMRTPIGNTFVSETAYKKLIHPVVRTKMGTIIEPLSKDILVNKNN